MARLRTIKPGFFTNDQLGECSPLARLLFAGLWCHADRAGRLEDRPKRLKVEILPYDDCDIEALLGELVAGGFIVRYAAAGRRYIACPTFLVHQNPHVKEAESTIPPPPVPGEHEAPQSSPTGVHSASTVQAPDEHSSSRAGLVFGDLSLGSGLGSGGGVAPDADAPDAPSAPLETAIVPSRRTATAPPAANGRPRDLHWEALEAIFGPCRTRSERDARNAANKQFQDGEVDPADLHRAARNWPNVMADAVMTPHGLAKHLGMLLDGPQVNGRSKGVTVGMHHQATQKAALRAAPEDELAQAMRGRR